MNNFELEVNEKIEVIVNKQIYKSLIMDIDDDCIKINLPVNNGEYLLKEIGEELSINVYSKSGRCYSFNCKVIGKNKEGALFYYELSSPYNIKRIQRRSFFRVDIINEIKYKNITEIKEEREIEKIPFSSATMVDLSGGGIRLKSKNPINMNDKLLVNIKVKNVNMLVKGEVIRVETDENLEKICGIKFLDITEMQVDKIIEELFEVMRKQKTKL